MRPRPLSALTLVLTLVALPASAELLDPDDFASLGVLDTPVTGSYTIDTDALTFTDNAAPGVPLFVGVIDDQGGLADSYGPGGAVTTIGPAAIPHIAVFAFDSAHLRGTVTIRGHRALALVSKSTMTIESALDLRSTPGSQNVFIPEERRVPGCTNAGIFTPGPGGFPGGEPLPTPQPGFGAGGGGPAANGSIHRGGSGGNGGRGQGGVAPYGVGGVAVTDLAAVLRGGSGGGAGILAGNENCVSRVGGGGALELAAKQQLSVGDLNVSSTDSAVLNGNFFNGIGGSGVGSGGAVRLSGSIVTLTGSLVGNGGRSFVLTTPSAVGGGGAVHIEANSVLLAGATSAPAIGAITLKALCSGGCTVLNAESGRISFTYQNALLVGSNVFQLAETISVPRVGVGDEQTPLVEIWLRDLAVFDASELQVAAGGFENIYEITLGGNSARVTGAEPMTNSGILVGGAAFETPLINTATGQVSAVHKTLVFPGDGLANDDGLVNLGTLNLIEAVVDGDVRSPAGSQINVAGAVEFNGFVSGAASFSGTQNLIVFNGGYSPGDSP